MSLYRFIFLCLCIFITSQLPVTAQEAEKKVKFEGTILDSKTGETLPVVVVHIKELNMWTTSNLEGVFTFKNIKPGTYTAGRRIARHQRGDSDRQIGRETE